MNLLLDKYGLAIGQVWTYRTVCSLIGQVAFYNRGYLRCAGEAGEVVVAAVALVDPGPLAGRWCAKRTEQVGSILYRRTERAFNNATPWHAVVPSQPMGPPPTFPEMELPEHTELSAKDTLLLVSVRGRRSPVSPHAVISAPGRAAQSAHAVPLPCAEAHRCTRPAHGCISCRIEQSHAPYPHCYLG